MKLKERSQSNHPFVSMKELTHCLFSEINTYKLKNKEKPLDKAKILKASAAPKMDPRFQKLQEAQAKATVNEAQKK